MKLRIKAHFSNGRWTISAHKNYYLLSYGWGRTIQESLDGFRAVNNLFNGDVPTFTTDLATLYVAGPRPQAVTQIRLTCTTRPRMWAGYGETEKEAAEDFFYLNKPAYLWQLTAK